MIRSTVSRSGLAECWPATTFQLPPRRTECSALTVELHGLQMGTGTAQTTDPHGVLSNVASLLVRLCEMIEKWFEHSKPCQHDELVLLRGVECV